MATRAIAPLSSAIPAPASQRDFTRLRIRNAARELFYASDYASVTMEQIANAAGLSRPTVYLHYRDKTEIFSDIVTDYAPRASAMMAQIPGPDPTARQITRWFGQVVKFADSERAPLQAMLEIGQKSPEFSSLWLLSVEMIAGLAQRIPAFEKARDSKGVAHAHAHMLILQMTFACNVILFGSNKAFGSALRQVVVDAFVAFIQRHADTTGGEKSSVQDSA